MELAGLHIGQLVLNGYQRVVEADSEFERLFGPVEPGCALEELVSERDRHGSTELAGQLNRYRPGDVIDLLLTITVFGQDRYTRMRMVAEGNGYRAYFEPADAPGTLTSELAHLRQRWRAVFGRSEDGIAMLDDAGVVIEHNGRFVELLGMQSRDGIMLTEDALLGCVLADLVPASLAPVASALRSDASDFQLSVSLGLDVLDIQGRMMRAPGSERSETFLLVRDVTQHRQIEARDEVIRRDLERAARYQRTVLGKPPAIEGLAFGVAYKPLDAVGGDVYDAALLPDGTLRLFIADATGHGIEAALATILIKNEYDAIKRRGSSPGAALRELNNRIVTHHKVETMFSCTIVDVDLMRNKLRYANAGHPAPLLVRGGSVEELEEDGALVGVKANLRFPEWQLDLEAWEALVLVTDGVADTRDAGGQPFGKERLFDAILEARRRGSEISDELAAQTLAFRGLAVPHDDVTALCVSRVAVAPRVNPRS